jgi:hypothetical protein
VLSDICGAGWLAENDCCEDCCDCAPMGMIGCDDMVAKLLAGSTDWLLCEADCAFAGRGMRATALAENDAR